eukprot:GHVU01067218.1.p1 GENE.GHVU01067218.1~~GHVU01067218.1.p1  ORF type:complete len:528 (+),score=122.54 GHVU01067218.1:1-1584(+)
MGLSGFFLALHLLMNPFDRRRHNVFHYLEVAGLTTCLVSYLLLSMASVLAPDTEFALQSTVDHVRAYVFGIIPILLFLAYLAYTVWILLSEYGNLIESREGLFTVPWMFRWIANLALLASNVKDRSGVVVSYNWYSGDVSLRNNSRNVDGSEDEPHEVTNLNDNVWARRKLSAKLRKKYKTSRSNREYFVASVQDFLSHLIVTNNWTTVDGGIVEFACRYFFVYIDHNTTRHLQYRSQLQLHAQIERLYDEVELSNAEQREGEGNEERVGLQRNVSKFSKRVAYRTVRLVAAEGRRPNRLLDDCHTTRHSEVAKGEAQIAFAEQAEEKYLEMLIKKVAASMFDESKLSKAARLTDVYAAIIKLGELSCSRELLVTLREQYEKYRDAAAGGIAAIRTENAEIEERLQKADLSHEVSVASDVDLLEYFRLLENTAEYRQRLMRLRRLIQEEQEIAIERRKALIETNQIKMGIGKGGKGPEKEEAAKQQQQQPAPPPRQVPAAHEPPGTGIVDEDADDKFADDDDDDEFV